MCTISSSTVNMNTEPGIYQYTSPICSQQQSSINVFWLTDETQHAATYKLINPNYWRDILLSNYKQKEAAEINKKICIVLIRLTLGR